jgi:hypothetical protein
VFLQFRQNLSNFRLFAHRGYLRIVRNRQFVVVTDGLQHLKHLRIFVFGEEVDLKLKVVPLRAKITETLVVL